MEDVKVRAAVASVGLTAATISAIAGFGVGLPSAAADDCPNVEVVWARGTDEPAGLGGMGEGFVEKFIARTAGKSVGTYAVNYPATSDFTPSASAGGRDARAHVEYMAATCPQTRLVLGGYSQGAGVMALLTNVSVLDWEPSPLPPDANDNVAALVVFGNPSSRFGAGPLTTSPEYGSRAIDLCIPLDPVCAPSGQGIGFTHGLYGLAGLVDQAADFAAARV